MRWTRVVQNDGCADARSATVEVDPLAHDVAPHRRVFGIGVAAVPFGHPASGLGERYVEEHRPVPAVGQLVTMQKHPLDDDHCIGRHMLVQRVDWCIGAVVEDPPSDSSIATRAERIQNVPDQCDEVVGVAKKALRRVAAQAVADLSRRQEVVLVHDEHRASGVPDRGRKTSREGRLARSVHAVDRDNCGTSECSHIPGEFGHKGARARGHTVIMPSASARLSARPHRMRHVRMFFGLASGIEGEAAQQLRSLVVGRLSVAEAGEVLRSCGLEPQHVLGSGMEGVVFSFGQERVVKVWFDRSLEEVQRLSQFYAAAAAGGHIRVTQIDQVMEAVGRVVSVELFVAGTPLRADANRQSLPSEGTAQSIGDALEGLAAVQRHAALSSLPLLPGERPAAPGTSFTKALRDMVRRRVPPVSRTLDSALDGRLESVVGRVLDELVHLRPRRHGLVHGDLVPDNLLLLEGAPPGIIDFGFLTTYGDPDFDVAITPAIFDMYGPKAKLATEQLTCALTARFGTPATTIRAYRHAYALITAGAYGTSLEDGHFAWCVDVLRETT